MTSPLLVSLYMTAAEAATLLHDIPSLVQDSTSVSHQNTEPLPQDFGTGIERESFNPSQVDKVAP